MMKGHKNMKLNQDVWMISGMNIIVDTRKNSLIEAVLTSTHSICFRAKIRKKMYTPVHPSFTIYKSGV